MATGNPDDGVYWYKDAVIYELHVKAFRDGNGDGIGDFKGLLEKLDYLQDLGVTAIWLLPFYPSPFKDDGYDIADYYQINPAYGDITQFQEVLQEAHARGLKVITELVINHTSDQHPWFQRARRAHRDSPERKFYVWTDDPSQYKDVRIIFQDFEASNWTWDPVAGQYYWHRFFYHQPDLNYDHPDVQEEVFRIIDHWCKMGVDGFRLDAVPYLFEREGTNGENLPETHAFLKKLRRYVDDHYPGTLLLAEANMWPEEAAAYFGTGDECHMNYHFPVMPRMFMALQSEDRYPITDIFEQTPDIPANCQWAMFLRNHDELTLEMVTDEERDYMYKVYVKDPRARINLGIRHRLAPLLGNSRKKIELLNYLLFSLPGTPVLYYGDEIGMGDNFYLGDRDGVRTPMQWTPGRNAGFSDANPHRLYLPVILDPEYHYESVNVEMQHGNTSSLLWWMKRLISKRKQYKAFSRGDLKFIASENPKILAFTRTYEQETMLVVVNLSRYTQPVELNLQAYRGYMPVEIFSKNKFPSVKEDTAYFMTMSGHDCEWFLLQPVHPEVHADEGLPVVVLQAWEGLVEKEGRYIMENMVLPQYLMRMRWFGGKSRVFESINIVRHVPVPMEQGSVMLLFIEVTYQSGLPEIYQLPVAFARDTLAGKLRDSCPQSVVARLRVGGDDGLLYDAIYGYDFQRTLLLHLASQHSWRSATGGLYCYSHESVDAHVRQQDKIKPRVLSAEQSNTSITYDGKFFLKLFRKVDKSINPDVEMIHFLTDQAHFTHVPAFMGALEWREDKAVMVLGLMQEMVESNGDAWTYILERLDEYNDRVLALPDSTGPELIGSRISPLHYDAIPEKMRDLLEARVADHLFLLGVRTGEMHQALLRGQDVAEFSPEPYTLHYQRSLFSGLQSLVRATFQNLQRSLHRLSPAVLPEAERVLAMRGDILEELRKIYRKKIDVVKIRIHGDYHLGQVLFTGKDFIITDFEGEPARSYSERRLKRSPLRDVAGMMRSLHYAAYASLFLDNQIRQEDFSRLMPYAEAWYHYMSGIFLEAYRDTVAGSAFFPAQAEDLEILLTTFLLEKAIYELNYELNNRPDWVVIPLRGIQTIMMRLDIQPSNNISPLAETKIT